MSIKCFARIAVVASLLVGLGATRTAAAKDGYVILASGELDDRFLADSLFHIGEFWMKVTPNTEFHRWLSQGIHRNVVISLTTNPAQFADARNRRILIGTQMHEIASNPTPMTNDVFGRLPEGDSPLVHILFLKDELSGSLGAVTFETSDRATAAKFAPYDSTTIGIVIQID